MNDKEELEIKKRMCLGSGLVPLFITRAMPASYLLDVRAAEGFCLLLGEQQYPLLARELAKEVRGKLGLPVICVRQLPDTALQRFEKGHEKLLAARKTV